LNVNGYDRCISGSGNNRLGGGASKSDERYLTLYELIVVFSHEHDVVERGE